MPPKQAAFSILQLFAFLFAFTLLICNTAAGLASRLAGSLALAASALFSAFTKVLCFDSLDVLHNLPPNKYYLMIIS